MKEKLKELWEKTKDKATDLWETVSEKAIALWAEKKVLIVASTGGLIIVVILISSIVRTASLAPKNETAKVDTQVEELAIDDSTEKPETVSKEEKKKEDSDKDKNKEKEKKKSEKEDDEDDEEEVDEETEKKEFEFVELKDFKDVKAIQKVYSDLNIAEGNHAMEVSTDDFYFVQTKNGQGLLDSKGNWVLKPEYKSITYTNKGYVVSKDDKFFLFKDNKINEVTNNYLTYKVTDEEAKGCGWNTDYGTLALLSVDKDEIIDFKYKQSKPIAVLAVKINGETYDVDGVPMSAYTIDKNNKFAIVNGNKCLTGFDYDNAGAFSDGLLAVEKNGKWGYVDEKGKIVIECKYDPVRSAYSTALDKSVDFAPSCTGGYITVCKKGKYAILDKQGKIAVPYGRYEYISEVTDGRCYVLSDSKWGIISVNGKKILGTLQKNKYSLSSGEVLDADPPKDEVDDEDKDKEESDEEKDKEKDKDKSVSANNASM